MSINELVKGKLVPCVILKAGVPDEAYVVNILGTEKIALLPKDKSQKIYKIGEPLFAIVDEVTMLKTYLTQKNSDYVRHITMGALSYLKKKVEIKDIAYIQNTNFCKVSLSTNEDIKDIAKKSITYFLRHLNINIALIKYSSDIKEYILNAIAPAPPDYVQYISVYTNERRADLYVPKGKEGLVLGTSGKNVACAAKLTGYSLQVHSI